MFFPYAAQVAGRWWVLRANYCFPAHDMCTVFIDGRAVADVTAGADEPCDLCELADRDPYARSDPRCY